MASTLLHCVSSSMKCISVRSANEIRLGSTDILFIAEGGLGTAEPEWERLSPRPHEDVKGEAVADHGNSGVLSVKDIDGGRTLMTEKEEERWIPSCLKNLSYSLCLRSANEIQREARSMMIVALNAALT